MLKVLRDNLKYLSWILWVVIAVFVLFVFVDFGQGVPAGGVRESAATVGDDTVTWGEYQRAYQQMEERMRQTYGESFTPELANQMQLPMRAMNQLVGQKILLAEAEKMELLATDEEVRRAVLEIDAFRDAAGNFIGTEQYGQVLRANGYSVADFETTLRDQILIRKLNDIFAQGVYVSDGDAEKTYRDRVETATIRYMQQRVDQLPATAVQPVSDAELESYFAAHRSEFELPEQRVIEYLLVDANAIRGSLTVTDEEIASFYDANPGQYKREEEVRVRHILVKVGPERTAEAAEAAVLAAKARIEGGEDFTAVAAAVSEDDSNKARGGDLGFFGRNRMVKPFEDAAFAAELGALVGPLRTDFGFHILQVLERREPGIRPLAEAQGEIRARLLNERTNAAAEAKANELRAKAEAAKVKSAEAFRKLAEGETGVTAEVTPPFGRADSVPNIGRSAAFLKAAFELPSQGVSAPVRVPRGQAVLFLAEVRTPRQPELGEVTDQVRAGVEQQRKVDAAIARLAAAKQAIAGGKDFIEVAAELALEVTETESFGPTGMIQGLGMQPALAREAVSLAEGEIGGPTQVNPIAVVLYQVVSRTTFSPDAFAAVKAATRNGLRGERVESLLQALIDKRRRELNVSFDPRLLEQFELPASGRG